MTDWHFTITSKPLYIRLVLQLLDGTVLPRSLVLKVRVQILKIGLVMDGLAFLTEQSNPHFAVATDN